MLSEAAFVRRPVVCFGSGTARTYELATNVDAPNPPFALRDAHNPRTRTNALAYLYDTKQLIQAKLLDPEYIKQSYLADLLQLR